MQERNTQAASERKSPASSYPPQAPQNQESGWMMTLKIVFWLLLVPSAVLILFKWLMPA